ncbi:MAG: radical SAM family heme chaperone HemW [Propionibacteriaceae bacterium]|nr:radical SAM family heme chaperone HemW [Propionibacteriaceae bacterium]
MVNGAGELSLYIHVPWCLARCGYCDFNTYLHDPVLAPPYLQALELELDLAARTLGWRRVTTIYFGGGTPTLLSPGDYARLLQAVRAHFTIDGAAEITTEANPETLSLPQLEQLRKAGVNRLSLGMQSAVPHVLATLDRAHLPGRVDQAVQWARQAGFENLSLDLMYGTPGESREDWERTISAALVLEPEHISAYSLIVEDATPLGRRIANEELVELEDDELAEMYLLANERFSDAGLRWYEVSNWAKPGYECQHNLVYWRSGDWWGLGAGAHSHLRGSLTGEPPPPPNPRRRTPGKERRPQATRWWNYRHPRTYIEKLTTTGSPREDLEELNAYETHTEVVMLGLRLAEGLNLDHLSVTEQARAAHFLEAGFLTVEASHLVPTEPGRLIADGLAREILDR